MTRRTQQEKNVKKEGEGLVHCGVCWRWCFLDETMSTNMGATQEADFTRRTCLREVDIQAEFNEKLGGGGVELVEELRK